MRRYRIRLSSGALDIALVDDDGILVHSPWYWAAWLPWEDVRPTVLEQGHQVVGEEVVG